MNMLRLGVKLAAAGADLLHRPDPGVVILLYHRVGARTHVDVDLPAGRFEQQIAALARDGRVEGMDAALRVLAGVEERARPPVVVTFDDGTADVLEVALPILVRHQVPALLYVATAFIEEQRQFPDGGIPASWSALAEGVSTGLLEIGSHTHTHRLLDRVDAATARDELDRSVGLIHDRLAVEARHFAYPKAVAPNATSAAAVRERFSSAALAGTRANPIGRTDPLALARTPMQRSDGIWFARRKIDGGMGLEDRLRERRNGRRYADVTT